MKNYLKILLVLKCVCINAQNKTESILYKFEDRKQQILGGFNKQDHNKLNISQNHEINFYIYQREKYYLDKEFYNRELIVLEAKKYLGVPYKWGGSSPSAFDCSGLVQWTLKKTHGIVIPRTTDEQYAKWKNTLNNNIKEAKPGDLVYFKTFGNKKVSHVGIYIGDLKFIHSPKSFDVVQISEVKGYWLKNFQAFLSIKQII